MSENEQLKAIAELDGPKLVGLVKRGMWWRPNSGGYTNCECEAGRYTMEEAKKREYIHGDPDDVTIREFSTKPYLTSLDAIVPVIERQAWTTKILVLENLLNRNCSREITPEEAVKVLLKTPAQLTKALLLATGKWKD